LAGEVPTASVVHVDVSDMEDPADYGGLLFELKKMGILEGRDYQIEGNGCGLFMCYSSFQRCQGVLLRFGVAPVFPRTRG
jgi:hypothetical protein